MVVLPCIEDLGGCTADTLHTRRVKESCFARQTPCIRWREGTSGNMVQCTRTEFVTPGVGDTTAVLVETSIVFTRILFSGADGVAFSFFMRQPARRLKSANPRDDDSAVEQDSRSKK